MKCSKQSVTTLKTTTLSRARKLSGFPVMADSHEGAAAINRKLSLVVVVPDEVVNEYFYYSA